MRTSPLAPLAKFAFMARFTWIHGRRGVGRLVLQQVESNPPISQEGNLIRIGGSRRSGGDVSIDYTIVVPQDTQLRSTSGSGDVDVRGIQGPANFTCGSGDVTASENRRRRPGSLRQWRIKLSKIKGQARVTTGSGDITLDHNSGGDAPPDRVGHARNIEPWRCFGGRHGKRRYHHQGRIADVRLRTSSGEIDLEGNPGSSKLLGPSYQLRRGNPSRSAGRQFSALCALQLRRH